MMTTHVIELLLGGCLDPAFELQIATELPMMLRRIERADQHAPDYRIDVSGRDNFGYGWSQMAAKSSIPYIAIILEPQPGIQISGVAWQSTEHEGRWLAQLQSVAHVRLNS